MAAESPTGITPPYGSHLTCILTPDVDSQVFFNRKLFATIFPSIKLRWIFFSQILRLSERLQALLLKLHHLCKHFFFTIFSWEKSH